MKLFSLIRNKEQKAEEITFEAITTKSMQNGLQRYYIIKKSGTTVVISLALQKGSKSSF